MKRRPASIPPLALPLLALFCTLPAAAQTPAGSDGARIAAVRFAGAEEVDAARLRGMIETRESRCRSPLLFPFCALPGALWAEETERLDAARLRQDEQRLRDAYAAFGFPDAVVAATVVPRGRGGVEVRFQVEEGEPIRVRAVEIRGLEAIRGGLRLPPLPLQPGVPYSVERLEATQLRIARALAAKGHAFAAVEVGGRVVPAERAADVVLDVVPGPLAVFGPTRILAEPPISEAAVRRRLAYTGGDRYDPEALNHTIERLNRLPVVERAIAELLPAATGDSVVITTIGVSAARVQGLWFSGALSSASCLEGTLGWAHRHLFGAPRTLDLRLGAGNLLARPLRGFPCTAAAEGEFARNDYLASAELREPIGADSWLLLGGGVSRASAPPAFVRRGVEARVGISHMPTRGVELAATYAPERRDNPAGGVQLCALQGVCAGPALEALTAAQRIAPVEVGVVVGPPPTRVPPLIPPPRETLHELPEWLFTGRALLSRAQPALGSEWSFTRLSADGSARWMPGRRGELAARLRVAALAGDPLLPPQLRLFGGGPLGVRGVEANLLGPRILVASAETAAELGCVPAAGGCAGTPVDPRTIRPRPAGGDRLVEGGLEARLWLGRTLQGAAFVDAGWLRVGGALAGAPGLGAETVVTPGVGLLALTPFGPVRLDVAYDPSPARDYPLLVRSADGAEFLPAGTVRYDPFRFGDPSALREGWRRLQLQLTMGLPF